MKQVKIVQQSADELDLLVLLEKAIRYFSQYGKLLAGVALAGMLAAALLYWRAPNTYSSTLLVQPVLLTSPEQIEIVNSWSSLLKKKEYPELSAQWRVPTHTLKKLKTISVEELQKTFSPTNFTAYSISVKVTDTTVLSTLQKGMLYALDNGEYIKEKLAARKAMLRQLVQTVDSEITRLKAMQSSVEKELQTGTHSSPGFLVDVSSMSSQIASLEEKKLNLAESLSFTSSAHALQNFYTPVKPESKLIKFLFMGFAVGLMLGGMLSLYIHVRRKMKIRAYAS